MKNAGSECAAIYEEPERYFEPGHLLEDRPIGHTETPHRTTLTQTDQCDDPTLLVGRQGSAGRQRGGALRGRAWPT